MKETSITRRRGSSAPVTLVPVDPSSATPLYRQIYESLREAILAGRLAAGSRVPTTRILASELQVSRNTAAAALDLLRAEGYVEVRANSGTFVSALAPDSALQTNADAATTTSDLTNAPNAANTNAASAVASKRARLSKNGFRLLNSRNRLMEGIKEGCRPFRIGVPAFDAFPYDVWSKLTNAHLQSPIAEQIGYGPEEGHPHLRDVIAAYVTTARGAHCNASQIVITNGAQQALDIIAQMVLDRGDTVWLEDPGYPGARTAFEAVGATVMPVPVDDEGMNITAAPSSDAPRLLYVTPSHQYPTGVTMSNRRRADLLRYAHANDAWIVEDDYDSEFRYESRPLTCLQGLDKHSRVIYVGTFSKMLFPGLRLGYLILPQDLVEAASAIRTITDRHSSMLDQGVLASFIEKGYLSRHMRRMRTLYKKRRDSLEHALRTRIPAIEIINHDAGLHFLGRLHPRMNETRIAEDALEVGVEVVPLNDFVRGAAHPPALMFGFAAFTPVELDDAVERLAPVINQGI